MPMTVEAIVEAIRALPDRDIDRVHREVWDDEPLTEEEEAMLRQSRIDLANGDYTVLVPRS